MGARRAIGFECDAAVFDVTSRKLAIMNVDLTLSHLGDQAGLNALRVSQDQLLIAFVAPPWGDALSGTSGLDLRQTQPPTPEIIDLIARTFPAHKVLLAMQVYETVVPSSLTAVTCRCGWSASKIYDLNAPGQNHGLLSGTLGWAA